MLSPIVPFDTWDELSRLREESRSRAVEGIMLKRLTSPYRVGRVRGDWWKWKVDPFTVDAVLTAAQRGSGKRASLYTDYTFGVWPTANLSTLRRRIPVSTTPRFARSIASSANTPPESLDPFAPSNRNLFSNSASRGSPARPAINRASPCASRESFAGATTRDREDADSLETILAMLNQNGGDQ